MFTGFLPAVGDKKKVVIKQKIKSFNWQAMLPKGLNIVAKMINPYLHGIINYYSKFYPSELRGIWQTLDTRLVVWLMKKSKKLKGKKMKTYQLLSEIKSHLARRRLFALWSLELMIKAQKET
ncbi:group II intron maturase-specific domain-containing protein [Thorsellia kenyensis]|uniref:Group II intron maturase-specific domain-containing protein n=1 Tax=Thorsellia kenyensis TaxID=1549888 RepID=A0ABV6CA78_9GAMM